MKRVFTSALAAVVVLALLTGCTADNGPGNQDELTKVRVTEFRGMTWAPMYIAYQNGYFEDEGLEVELVRIPSGPNCFRAMHSGQSEFCILSQEVALKAQEEGVRSTNLATMLDTRYYAFVATEEIRSVEDLRGKTAYASDPGSAPYTFCVAVMEEAGLEIGKDVTLVSMDKGAIMTALETGEIQAAFINADNYTEADSVEGLHYLVDTRNPADAAHYLRADSFPAEVILSTEAYKNANPEVVQGFVNAVCKGLDWLQSNSSADAAKLIAELFSGMTEDVILEKIEIMRGAYSVNGYISPEGEAAVVDFSVRSGIISPDFLEKYPYEEIVDMSFVNNAIEAGIVPSK